MQELDYDFALLDRAVRYKRRHGDADYPALETILEFDEDWQNQCAIYEQVIDWSTDYDKANPSATGRNSA